MASGKNELFIADPVAFIKTTAIDITLFDASVTGRPRYMDQAPEDVWFSMHKSLLTSLHEVAFDLMPRSTGGFLGLNAWNFCVLRFDRRTFAQAFLNAIEQLKKDKSAEAVQQVQTDYQTRGLVVDSVLYRRYLTAKRALDSFAVRYTSHIDEFVTATAPIRGYFFPYASPPNQIVYNNGTWGIPQMGFVDVPRQNPAHDFVFTGMMNGCALVFADSPVGRTHFRVFHYPNIDSYPRFKSQMFWTGKPRWAVWTVEEYGSDADPNGFNFLHFDRGDNRWYLCCQPQTQHRVTGGTVMDIRHKAVRGVGLPGRIPLSTLGNYFVDDYV